MKSPHTLISLHERAIRIQEMIRNCDYYAESHDDSIRRYKIESEVMNYERIKHHKYHADRCRRISNYLQTRYTSLLKQLQ